MLQKIEVPVYLKKTTTRFAVYESRDGSVIKYVLRELLPKSLPDVLMDTTRALTFQDAPARDPR